MEIELLQVCALHGLKKLFQKKKHHSLDLIISKTLILKNTFCIMSFSILSLGKLFSKLELGGRSLHKFIGKTLTEYRPTIGVIILQIHKMLPV